MLVMDACAVAAHSSSRTCDGVVAAVGAGSGAVVDLSICLSGRLRRYLYLQMDAGAVCHLIFVSLNFTVPFIVSISVGVASLCDFLLTVSDFC